MFPPLYRSLLPLLHLPTPLHPKLNMIPSPTYVFYILTYGVCSRPAAAPLDNDSRELTRG